MVFPVRAVIVLGLVSIIFLACERVAPPAKVMHANIVPAAASRREEPSPPPATPNILLIALNTWRDDATGLAPQGTKRAPFLRQLAAKGVEFTPQLQHGRLAPTGALRHADRPCQRVGHAFLWNHVARFSVNGWSSDNI